MSDRYKIFNKNQKNSNKMYKEFEDNNTYYDTSGNMNIWRVHETYAGTGNYSIWDDILTDKKKKQNDFIKGE